MTISPFQGFILAHVVPRAKRSVALGMHVLAFQAETPRASRASVRLKRPREGPL